jgi:hypothetical protein
MHKKFLHPTAADWVGKEERKEKEEEEGRVGCRGCSLGLAGRMTDHLAASRRPATKTHGWVSLAVGLVFFFFSFSSSGLPVVLFFWGGFRMIKL